MRDEYKKVGIGGASVQVQNAAGAVLGTALTGRNGNYSVSGLAIGASVNAVYSSPGYAPDKCYRPVKLSKAEVIQDVALLCDCTDAATGKLGPRVKSSMRSPRVKTPPSKPLSSTNRGALSGT